MSSASVMTATTERSETMARTAPAELSTRCVTQVRLLGVSAAYNPSGEEGVASRSTSDDQALLELVQRLLIYPYPDGPTSVDLLASRLPEDRSVELPVPDGAQVIGSAVYRRGREIVRVDSVVRVAGSTDEVTIAYEAVLRRGGWELFEPFREHHGGFVSSNFGLPRRFRRKRDDPVLLVDVVDDGAGNSELRLALNWSMPRSGPPRRHHLEAMDRVPSLVPPPGVHVDGSGSGGGDTNWSSSATARTVMPASELEAYFAGQLAHADWTRFAGDAHDVAAWSAWNLPGGGHWSALLLIIAFDHEERSLSIHMQRPHRHDPRAWAMLARAPWRRVHF